MKKYSFDPIISPQPKILILGSLPGDLSLELQQYYGHPQNRFWKLMFHLFHLEYSTDYNIRQQFIKDHHIALWDVAHSASRVGSMDSDMKNEVPNPIHQLLAEYPSIDKVIFNGKKAEGLYLKHFKPLNHIHYFSLPSTSPANARYTFDKLEHIWSEALFFTKQSL